MPKSSWCLLLVMSVVLVARAQVVTPVEIKDPVLRDLQLKYMDDLKAAGADIINLPFEYPFYLSRKLDLDEAKQRWADQRSLRFERYNAKTVIAITGNYFAAYNAEQLNKGERAHKTFFDVVEPLLKATVPHFQNNKSVDGYAIEISHHVRGKAMGVSMERPENFLVYVPQIEATRFVTSKDESVRQAALLEGQFFVNGEPVTIWANGEGPQMATAAVPDAPVQGQPGATPSADTVRDEQGHVLPAPTVASFPKRLKTAGDAEVIQQPARNTSPEALSELLASNQELLTKMVKDVDPQAHFVTYAAPSFVAFRQGIYLELSVNTALPESAAGSRYKLAAVAFDDHVSHLIRPLLGYFNGEQKFDGIGVSTTVHLAGKNQSAAGAQAIEFYFPFAALKCYQKYDCTGQQLIDAATVLINGERVGLDLQIAEGGSAR